MATARATVPQTAERIKELLLSGTVSPGEKLPPEMALTEQLQVSRPTVREALRFLEAAGYIEQIPNRGCFARITDPTAEKEMLRQQADLWVRHNGTSLEEFFEARLVLEPQAAAIAAGRQDKDAIAAVIAAQEAYRAAEADGNAKVLAARDNDIHAAIIRAAGNRHLCSFFEELTCFFVEYSTRSFAAESDIRRTEREHEAVIHAIRDGDAAGAEKAIREHLLTARREVGKKLG